MAADASITTEICTPQPQPSSRGRMAPTCKSWGGHPGEADSYQIKLESKILEAMLVLGIFLILNAVFQVLIPELPMIAEDICNIWLLGWGGSEV